MFASMNERVIRTSHADIAVRESFGRKLAVLFLHANSSCKEAFAHQFEGSLGREFHLIALDLPGHGASSDAFRPEDTYSIQGYADAAIEVLEILGVEKVVIVGWSLGGHVAMEMMASFPGVVGVMLHGAAPVGHGPDALERAYLPGPGLALLGQPDLSETDVADLQNMLGDADHQQSAVLRTDGRARQMVMGAFADACRDECALLARSRVPIALMNGACDPLVNTQYVRDLDFQCLWEARCRTFPNAGHDFFAQIPEIYNQLLKRFVRSLQNSAVTFDSHPGLCLSA